MGLDLIELQMGIEDEFEIEIPNQDAEYITTPREAADYVYQFRGISEKEPETICISQASFYQLRRALMSEFGLARADIKLQTPIQTIIPPEKNWWERYQIRKRFKKISNMRLPKNAQTLADLIPLMPIPNRLKQKQFTYDEILNRVMLITADQLGLSYGSFSPDAHFIEDLGADC